MAAKGDILLFLDDDMEADPQLLAEHARSHQEGTDVVLGHIPLHPQSPANFLSAGVNTWAEARLQRLSSSATQVTVQDLVTGQISLPRHLFEQLRGFDTDFTHQGSFGNEDIDFGYRLLCEGYKIVFNPKAISWQKYVVTPRQYLQQYRQMGRAEVMLLRKHPELANTILKQGVESLNERIFGRWLRLPMRWAILTLIDWGWQSSVVVKLYYQVWQWEYWQGIREAGGIPKPRSLRILCYHSISDLAGAPIIENYGIPPEYFRQQLDILAKAGFQFIDVEEFLRFLAGKGGLPRRSVLITFDDCYRDLLENAVPILQEQKIPAIAFAVSQRLGGTNEWDAPIGAPQLELLDADGLNRLVQAGVVMGSHSRTHAMLDRVSVEQASEEIVGSIADLEAIGLPKPILLAYPHGKYNQEVEQSAENAGIKAAFTVNPGFFRPGGNSFEIPRIEILRGDVGWKFRIKVFCGGYPFASLIEQFIAKIQRIKRLLKRAISVKAS